MRLCSRILNHTHDVAPACARGGSLHLAGPLWVMQRISGERRQGRSHILHIGGVGSDCERRTKEPLLMSRSDFQLWAVKPCFTLLR